MYTVFLGRYFSIPSAKHAKLSDRHKSPCELYITTWKSFRVSTNAYACSIIQDLFMDLDAILSVTAPTLCGQTQRSQSPSVLLHISSLHGWNGNPHAAHGSGHGLPLIFWADSYLSVTPPEISLAHTAVWNLSQRNPVFTVWPRFHYALTPRCLSVKSAGLRGGAEIHTPATRPLHPISTPSLGARRYRRRLALTAYNMAVYLMDLHGTRCSNTSSIVHREFSANLTCSNVLIGHSA